MPPLTTTQAQEIAELRSRLDWLDDERRKSLKRVTDLEQKLLLQERELSGREQRIKEVEQRLSNLANQIARMPQVDTQLGLFKDEIVALIEQYDNRRVRSEQEMERLRRVEHESNAREIAEIRKELPPIPRLQNDMELRQAEEARLANLIGILQNRIPPIESRIENWANDLAYIGEIEQKNNRAIIEIQTTLLEISKRWEPIYSRADLLANAVSKMESNIQGFANAQIELRQSIKSWAEQVQIGEYERNQRLNNWQRMLEGQEDMMRGYAQQWITFADQYKEARMAIQTLPDWQKHIEQQQREANELVRVEANRMQARWDGFVSDNSKKNKNFEVDIEQRIASSNRHERQLREQIALLEEKLDRIQQENQTLWRLANAQTDAIKQFPRIWQEEIQKTLEQDPNRRRQPALVAVREEL